MTCRMPDITPGKIPMCSLEIQFAEGVSLRSKPIPVADSKRAIRQLSTYQPPYDSHMPGLVEFETKNRTVWINPFAIAYVYIMPEASE